MNILIVGGSGFIGRGLISSFREEDHIKILSRDPQKTAKHLVRLNPNIEMIEGDLLDPSLWQSHLDGIDAVINMAGEPIAQRWTQKTKNRIYESRVIATRQLVLALSEIKNPPQVLINASAVGFYGSHLKVDTTFSESSPGGEDFLSILCQDWEAEALQAKEHGIRVCIVRIGIVLHPSGGMIERLLPLAKLGLAGRIGSGQQWMSWIHRDDLAHMIATLVRNDKAQGVFNGTSPSPVKNESFAETLAEAVGRPIKLHTPAFPLKLLFREGAEIMLKGQRVIPKRAVDELGFEFKFPTLQSAINEIIRLT